MMICARRYSWSWCEWWCFSLQLPGDTGIFHVAKNLPSFVWHPSSLYSLWFYRLHRALTWPAGVLCALLYRLGRSHCLRPQRNAATASYHTMQPGSFWRQASIFRTVSWGNERTAPGLRKPKPKICQSWLFFLFSRWSVVKLELNMCFLLLFRYRCLLGCCCESITCFFLDGQSWR